MKVETIDEAFSAWQQRCKAHGLTLTLSRQAILRALVEQHAARDAVPLLKAAQAHHATVSIGTVYRFLRELEQRGLVHAHAQIHGRTLWRLRSAVQNHSAQAAGDIRRMVMQVQDFLHALEELGLAQSTGTSDTAMFAKSASNDPTSNDPMLAVLHDLAGYLGYRLLLRPHVSV